MLTENQKKLASCIGKLKAEIESQFTPDVTAWDEEIAKASTEREVELAGAKAAPADFVDTGLELAKAIATETGNAKAIELVNDLANTAEDALHAKYLALFGDLLKDFQAIKSATKK